MTRAKVYSLIDGERDYQELRHAYDKHSVGDWLTFMRYYLDEATAQFTTKSASTEDPLIEVRKLAALAVACMEQHDTPARE
jgi:hypothetical protein